MTNVEAYHQELGQIENVEAVDLGLWKNFQITFGPAIWTYPFPFFVDWAMPTSDGINFPSRDTPNTSFEQSIINEIIQ